MSEGEVGEEEVHAAKRREAAFDGAGGGVGGVWMR